jgi:hypothetical protein
MKLRGHFLSIVFSSRVFHQSLAFQPHQYNSIVGADTCRLELSVRAPDAIYQTTSKTWEKRFEVRVPDAIYLTTSKTWEKRFEELIFFLQENGHCNVPRNHGPLGNWVQKQRLSYKIFCLDEGKHSISSSSSYSSPPQPLSKEQAQLLDEIGFIWDIHEYKYQCNLDELKEFYVRHSHIDVPSSLDGEYRSLYKWLCRQKEEYKNYLHGDHTKLTDDRRRSMENLGFHIGMFEIEVTGPDGNKAKRISWDGRYQQLLQFKEEYEHCNVPTNDEHFSKLSGWVQHQRAEKKKKVCGKISRLTDENEQLLESAGFVWSIKEWNWVQRLEDLKQYKQLHGHCNVPTRDGELGGWVMTQRLTHGRNMLPKAREEALNDLGFIWDMHHLAWEEKYNLLCCELTPMTGSLNSWIATQRSEKRYKELGLDTHLTLEREEKLNALGFEWNVNEERDKYRHDTWMKNFDRLKQHIKYTGSSKLLLDEECDGFPIWVRDQRRYLKAFENEEETPMTQDRRDLLLSVGFI